MSTTAAGYSFVGFTLIAAVVGFLWLAVPWDNPAYQGYMIIPHQKEVYAAIAACAALLAGVSLVLCLRSDRQRPSNQQ